MKQIAFVHDYIKEYGGAERVLETLHAMYPNAPVFTLVYAPQFLGPHKKRFANWDIRPSFLQSIPFSYKFISIYRLIAPLIFKTFNFSQFDIVLVSATGAYQPNVINKNHAKLICYCHTPPRYLYGYATAREQSKNPLIQAGIALMAHVLRMVDFVSAQNVDQFIANSENTAARIKKFYRRDSIVVYPPVDVSENLISAKKQGYFLAGGRLARPKHMDIIVKACSELGVQLKVFGRGFAGYEENLKSLLQQRSGQAISNLKNMGTIEFLGEVGDEEKLNLMREAKAFIFASEDEDFGIVPVEAMAQGTPVIAYKSGGVVETVVNGKTGIFFDTLTVESLKGAIKEFALRLTQDKIKPEDCFLQAKKFAKQEFEKRIQKVVNNI